jgi:hypothetical protein
MEYIALDVHMTGDVAQDSIGSSGAGRFRNIHGLAEVAFRMRTEFKKSADREGISSLRSAWQTAARMVILIP